MFQWERRGLEEEEEEEEYNNKGHAIVIRIFLKIGQFNKYQSIYKNFFFVW
jgi:hypothetical protein